LIEDLVIIWCEVENRNRAGGTNMVLPQIKPLRKGEKMPKQVMFIIFIAVIILAGFLAYTQVQMLR